MAGEDMNVLFDAFQDMFNNFGEAINIFADNSTWIGQAVVGFFILFVFILVIYIILKLFVGKGGRNV